MAQTRSLMWYRSMQVPDEPRGVLRISRAHDTLQWPGMMLPGTYNGLMGQALIGGLDHLDTIDRQMLTQWLLKHRRADGVFRIPGMHDDAVFKKPNLSETWEYIDFHVTNYCLGAIEFISEGQAPTLTFAEKYLDRKELGAWLSQRDLRDPWQEGNNIVNLASFLLIMQRHCLQTTASKAAIQELFAWHDRLQEPSTGFWGVGQHSDPRQMLHAMAGSMHNYHLWYATGRPLAHQDRATDYSLSQPARVHSACIDVDLVDLLVHAYWQIDHRRADIRCWLRELLSALLAFQNDDGGFADMPGGPGVPVWRQDGWIRGYAEPQGISNTFSTWFRWIAIAMISRCLWPEWAPWEGSWQFRRMIGIGYCQSTPANWTPFHD